MNIKTLQSCIKNGESQVLEFKQTTAELKTAMRTLCAFLNSDVGGTVLFGVTDSKKIVGQIVADSTRKEIAQELSKIEPHADIKVHFVPIDEGARHVIAMEAKAEKSPPYLYDGRAYMRSQSTTRRMSQEEYEHMFMDRRTSVSWDRLATHECTINDLDKKRIRAVIKTAIEMKRLSPDVAKSSVIEILKKLGLLVENKLTNAAVILFCKNDLKQFIRSGIRMARFAGTDKSEFLDHKYKEGNLFDLYDGAMEFIDNYLPIAGRITDGSPIRVVTPAIPYKVLREALVNALCHRDYSINSSMAIAFYDDRVEVSNPGRLPHGIKIRDLSKLHESHPRNHLIAKVLYMGGMIEHWGRGTLDMIKICKESGNPIPKFEETTGNFYVILPLKDPVARIKP